VSIGSFDGRVVAITGAGSGIGRALALEAAARGAHLALSDVDADRVDATAALLTDGARHVTTATLDVADRDAVVDWAEQVVADHGSVNVIVNNAGVALMAPVAELEIDDFRWLMDINFWGVVHGTQAFLPHLKASDRGHVVNISSVFGLMAIPSQAAYNASKFAVRGFTDALRIELEVEGAAVSATTIHPGGIKTNIARDARGNENDPALRAESERSFDAVARTTPEKAARQILDAVEKDRRRALIGPDAIVFDAVARLPAVVPQRLLAAFARRRLQS
jgi:butyryl-CoA dehydrogenase